MVVKFPIFVFTDYGYEAYSDVNDFVIKCSNRVKKGLFEGLEFIDSDGILRKIKKIEIDHTAKISLFRHLFYRCKLCKVKLLEIEEFREVSREDLIERMINAVCYVPAGASQQFDKDELHYVLTRKKTTQHMIEYFAEPVPENEQYQET